MDEEKRTCKTCHCFRGHANYCACRDSAQAEWDTCPDHKTYDEMVEKAEKWESIQDSPYLAHEDPEYIKGDAEFQWNKLKECRGKIEAIEKLMRIHPRIMINQNNQYSIMPMNPSDGDKFAKAIMTILYPDEK